MAEVGYFFDAVQDANTGEWDKTYTSADFAQLFGAVFTNGVIPAYMGGLAVTTGTTGTLPTVTVASGAAVINGRVYVNTETLTKTISALTGAVSRVDRIIVELHTANRTYCVKVLEGTPAARPVAPSVTHTNVLYQLALADVLVTPGSSTIINSASLEMDGLTDQRANTSVCGWCSIRLRDVDLSGITQAWYESLKEVYDPDAEIDSGTGDPAETAAQIVLALRSEVSALKTAFTLVQADKDITSRALVALLHPGAPTANENPFGRQSLVAREPVVNPETQAVTGIAANDFDLIAVTFRYATDPDTEYARVLSKSADCYLTCVGTNPHPTEDNITDAEIKKRSALQKRTDFYDYMKTVTVFLRKGETTEARFYDKYKNLWVTREVRWLTEDYSVICSGGSYKSNTTNQDKVPSVRFGATSSVKSNKEVAVETFSNAIYFGNVRYKDTGKSWTGDMQEWTRGTKSAGYSKSDITAFNKNPVNINKDYNQLLIPVSIIGFAFKASGETAARYHPLFS